ncbi:MAG: PKD domain-containing protein [Candidatus Bipolaricaulia bacterium]
MTSIRWRIGAAAVIVAALALLGGIASSAQQVGSLQISQTVEPQALFEKGSGVEDEETAEVQLKIEAPELPERLPTDLMLVVDRSASFPVDEASRAAERLIDALGSNDRVGLVSFATEATVDAPLSTPENAGRVRNALDDLEPKGKTGLGGGVAVAADQLNFAGRDNAERVVVVFTDGRSNYGRDPIKAAKMASDNGVTVHSVGIGEFPNRDLLTELAETTGGQFFETFSDSIARTVFESSIDEGMPYARNLEVVTAINSAFTFERALRNPPDATSQYPSGATELTWRRSELAPESTWDLRFEVSAKEDGTFSLYNSTAEVRYTNIQGHEVEKQLPNVKLRVKPAPPSVNANFSFDPETPNRFDTISFTDESSVQSGGKIVKWEWDFGDGETSTQQNPSHQYEEDGTYRVDLTVTTAQGVEDTATETVKVATEPQVVNADFSYQPDDPTRFDEIKFNDRSSLAPRGQIERWRWNFGDGTISTKRNPTHQYDSDGTYRVTLTVTTDEGNKDTAQKTIKVDTPEQEIDVSFDYRPKDPTRFDELKFTENTSVEPRGRITDWEWSFGDGETSSSPNPRHQYDEDGTYRVTLTVTTDEDNKATAEETIKVDTPEQKIDVAFDYSPDDPTRFDTIEFTDQSTVTPRGRIIEWEWNFGDGETSSSQNPSHQYEEDGAYRVTLTVTTDEGNEATAEQTINVVTPEQEIDADFSFTPDKPTRFDTVQFTDESDVDPRGRITEWEWDFGDGETSTKQNPSHQYDEDGTYRVTLTVTTNEDSEASVTQTVTVETPPQTIEPDFTFKPSNPTRIDKIEFTDQTTVSPRGEVTEWHWDFGDGTTSTTQNPSHQYDEDGTYRVTLTVTTDEGNEATVTKAVKVSTPPVKATRTIETHIPTDQTLPTRTFRVTIDLQVNVPVNGLGLDENVPDGWSVTVVENSTAQLRSDELQWLFSETLEPGDTRTIVYDVTVPEFDNPGTFQLEGTVSSASPNLNVAVEGDTDVEIVPGFSIPVVIAHWDTSNDMLDLAAFPDHTVNKNQILQAVAWWQEGTNVPNTQDAAGNKQAIDFAVIQKLVAYWLTDTSVFEELPEIDLSNDDKDDNSDDDDSS